MKKLYRSVTNRKLAGVCGGLAEYLGLDADIVRLVTALLVFVGGLSIWVYVIAAIILPEESVTMYSNDVTETTVEESTEE